MDDPTRRGFLGMIAAIPLAATVKLDNVSRQTAVVPFEPFEEQIYLEHGFPEPYTRPMLTWRFRCDDGEVASIPCHAEPAKGGGVRIISEKAEAEFTALGWEVCDENGNCLLEGDCGVVKDVRPGDAVEITVTVEEY